MMHVMGNKDYTDEQLTAYLDNELDPQLSEEIRQAAQEHTDLEQRIEEFEIQKSKLVHSMDQLLTLAPAMPDLPVDLKAETKSKAASWGQGFRALAAGSAMLVIGGIGGFVLNQQPEDGWRDYVAAYHLLYVNSTLSNLQPVEDVQNRELSLVSDAISKPIALDSLTRVASLDYKRAQILGFSGRPLAQMTFLSKMGEPIALCIIRSNGDEKTDPEFSRLEGMVSATWKRAGYEYLLIGGNDQNLIREAAQEFSKIL